MRTCAVILVLLGLLTASPARAASSWHEVVARTDVVLSDGSRTVVWGADRAPTATVWDTVRGTRRAIALPAGCGLPRLGTDNGEVGVLRPPWLLLWCGPDSRVLNLRSGAVAVLPGDHPWTTVGRRWARADASCGGRRGSSCGRFADLATGAQRILADVPPRDLDSATLAPVGWCPALDGPFRRQSTVAGGFPDSLTAAVEAGTLLTARWPRTLVLRRCGSPPRVLDRHAGRWPNPRLRGGWATWAWAADGDQVDDEPPRLPPGVVRFQRVGSSHRSSVLAPRIRHTACSGAAVRAAVGHAEHTRNRLLWVASLRTELGSVDCFAGPVRLFSRPLPART